MCEAIVRVSKREWHRCPFRGRVAMRSNPDRFGGRRTAHVCGHHAQQFERRGYYWHRVRPER